MFVCFQAMLFPRCVSAWLLMLIIMFIRVCACLCTGCTCNVYQYAGVSTCIHVVYMYIDPGLVHVGSVPALE